MPPLEHLTCSGKEGTGGCTKPPIWRGKEKTRGGRLNRNSKEPGPPSAHLAASSSAVECPVRDSPLVLVLCGGPWMGRALAECLLLGPAWGFRVVRGLNSP